MIRSLNNRFYYGWIVVAVTALALLVAAGVRSAPGVFLLPMTFGMGWSRATVSFAVSIGLIMFGLAGPLSGAIMNRFGTRWLMAGGMVLITLSMAMSARMQSIVELDLFWGLLSGLGTGVASTVLGAAVANRWFVARRGLVVGIFGAATSAGQLLFVPLLVSLVGIIGWRNGALVLGGTTLALVLPILVFMRNDPASIGLRAYGADDEPHDSPAIQANSGIMRTALRTPEFWLLAGTFFICGATSNGLIGTHFIPYAADCGIAPSVAAGTLALMGSFNFVGTIVSGWLTDRYDPRKLLCTYYGFRGVSLLLLPFVSTPWGLTAFAVLFGLDYIATVPPTTALVADKFGRHNVGVVFGWVFCAHQVGAALAAWLGGVVRDGWGSYTLAFLAAGGIAVAAGLLSLRVRRAVPSMPAVALS
ncbi:MAG TPA: MFS transporter [Roseiflexaceae bacterium]|nr:MFS transporter [Roseiflexaceae bacterium]